MSDITHQAPPPSVKHKKEEGLWETMIVILQALFIALIVRTLVFQPFVIPSGSMIPTLLIGDFVFVTKYSYGYSHFSLPWSPPVFNGRLFASTPKQGDVAVFRKPSDTSLDYIKRVIGMPGDKVQMREGRLYINNVLVPREPLGKFQAVNSNGRAIEASEYKEILPNGVSHKIIEIDGDTGDHDNTQVFEVPPDHYFMMGDNRDNSLDSRVSPESDGVGYVPAENLIGRAEFIFFSVDNGTPLWKIWKWPFEIRFDRIFKAVR